MPIKKSELYSSLWQSCDELRGGMDASQYKDYVLVLLFVKYVSDKAASQKGYLLDVPKGGSFADMVALKGDKEIGDKINKIIARLAEANDLKGVIDVADFNDADKLGKGKDMVDAAHQTGQPSSRRSGLRQQPRRGRRPAGRRLRISDAPLRHRVRQEQGPVLHPGGSLAHHGQGHRHRQRRPAPARPSTIRPAAPVRCCSRRTTKPRARPASTWRFTGRKWTTPPRRWRG